MIKFKQAVDQNKHTLYAKLPVFIIMQNYIYFDYFKYGRFDDDDNFVEVSIRSITDTNTNVWVCHSFWDDLISLKSDWIGEIPDEWLPYESNGVFRFMLVGNTVQLATLDCKPTGIVVQQLT